MCIFKDGIKTAVRSPCRADFLTLTYSKPTYKRYVLIRRRNASRKAATHCSNGIAVKSIATSSFRA